MWSMCSRIYSPLVKWLAERECCQPLPWSLIECVHYLNWTCPKVFELNLGMSWWYCICITSHRISFIRHHSKQFFAILEARKLLLLWETAAFHLMDMRWSRILPISLSTLNLSDKFPTTFKNCRSFWNTF